VVFLLASRYVVVTRRLGVRRFVGTLNIAIIIALKALTQELAEANERQKVLFQELQHRVADTLQSTIGKLEIVRRRMISSPAEAAKHAG
jgi:cysteine sulfinate desulfinase/cysteine desulfurase-like protein